MSDAWELLKEYYAGYEADLAISFLESAEIPVLRKGPETGIFGPGFAQLSIKLVQFARI